MVKKELTTSQRNQVVQFLLEDSIDGKPRRGKIAAAVVRFNSSRRTVSRLWSLARLQRDEGVVINIE